MFRPISLLALTALLAACQDNPNATIAGPSDAAMNNAQGGGIAGTVYTQTNSAAGNAVLVFPRAANGSLGTSVSVATGGNGSGAGLGSQGSVMLSADGQWLLVVNAGSNEVSSFAVGSDGALTLRGKASSGGTNPISVTVHDDLVYALNAGGTGNISALRLSATGALTPIAGSTRALSNGAAGPAEVSFDPTGAWLVVTEKATNNILTWRVGTDGLAFNRVINASSGATPFGFTFTNAGVLAVTEAFGGAVDASAVSTYTINANGSLNVISASAPTTETAACWIAASKNGKFVYATNAGSASISGYSVKHGELDLLDADGKTATTGAAAIDVAISDNGQFVYNVNNGSHTITGFAVSQSSGDLAARGTASIPVGAVGIAVR